VRLGGLVCNERQTDKELELAEPWPASWAPADPLRAPRQHRAARRAAPHDRDRVRPDSKQAGEYRQLAEKIAQQRKQRTIPTPITMDELEDLLMDFGIMKKEDESVIGKTVAELAA
jgi:nitrogenase iron protein NifH